MQKSVRGCPEELSPELWRDGYRVKGNAENGKRKFFPLQIPSMMLSSPYVNQAHNEMSLGSSTLPNRVQPP